MPPVAAAPKKLQPVAAHMPGVSALAPGRRSLLKPRGCGLRLRFVKILACGLVREVPFIGLAKIGDEVVSSPDRTQ
jgi:hypothetical protein